VAGLWFSPGTPVSFTNNTDRYDITEILLKVVLNTVILNLLYMIFVQRHIDHTGIWTMPDGLLR